MRSLRSIRKVELHRKILPNKSSIMGVTECSREHYDADIRYLQPSIPVYKHSHDLIVLLSLQAFQQQRS